MEIDFSKLVQVVGVDDLFLFVQAQQDNVVLQSLKKNTITAYSMNRSKIINLAQVEVFTTEGTISLRTILDALKSTTEQMPDKATSKADYYAFFLKICPNLDQQKVYFNNLKQILKWHETLMPFTLSTPSI